MPVSATVMPWMTTVRPRSPTRLPAQLAEKELLIAAGMPTAPATSALWPRPFWKKRATSTQMLVMPMKYTPASMVPSRKLGKRKICMSTIGSKGLVVFTWRSQASQAASRRAATGRSR